MKRFIIICSVIIAVLAINACEKLPKGTGTLIVEVSGFYYEEDVCIYPYGFDENTEPLHKEIAVEGKHNSFTFILNAGDYIVNVGESKVVQMHEGEEVKVSFIGGNH